MASKVKADNKDEKLDYNYCFSCHKIISAKDTGVKRCSEKDCQISVHSTCSADTPAWAGDSCLVHGETGRLNDVRPLFLQELLVYTMNFLSFHQTRPIAEIDQFLTNVRSSFVREDSRMTFKKIMEKLKDNEYTALEQFEADFYLLNHNVKVHSLKTESPAVSLLGKQMDRIMELFKAEVDYMVNCPFCYRSYWKYHTPDGTFGFLEACPTAHPVVWAQCSTLGGAWWPAKAFKNTNKRGHDFELKFFCAQKIDAQFEKGTKKMRLFSEQPPALKNAPKSIPGFDLGKELKTAKEWAKQYCMEVHSNQSPKVIFTLPKKPQMITNELEYLL